MDSTRLLITGANGQLGRALRERWPRARAATRDVLDVTDQDSVRAYDWSGVEVILNAAAYTKVDAAETPEGRAAAWLGNATATGYLAAAAAEHDLTLVHVSTDYVFDGTRSPHVETEVLTPLGVYAQSKAAGDVAAGVAGKHYILRASWVIGDGPNFVRTMMGLAAKGISPKVVGDQVGRLTFTSQLVDGIEQLLRVRAPYGVYNLSNNGEPASWAEITRAIFAELGRDDLHVTDTTTAEYFANKPEVAPRPLQSTLDLAKIEATGLMPWDWRLDLREYIAQEQGRA